MKKTQNSLFIEKIGTEYVVSLTPQLQNDIGTVGFVDYAKESGPVTSGEAVATLEASKTVFEIESPLTGTISQVNELVYDQPEALSTEDTEKNWLFKLTDVDQDEFNSFDDAE